MMKRRKLMLTIATVVPAACVSLRANRIPIHQVYDLLPGSPINRTLLVFMPGLLDYAEDFNRFGFNKTVRSLRLPIDMVSVDSNLRYFQNGTIVDRIIEDVIKPARQRGYKRIWLAGISLGGLGAMLVASRQADLDGLIAIAPFLGREASLAEIRAAGGHANWQPHPSSPMLDWETDLHVWLKNSLPPAADTRPTRKTRFILGMARQDRYALEQAELAAKLPAGNVVSIDGDHDWPTWQTLWQKILNKHGNQIAGLSSQHPVIHRPES